jgi:hypothetical protein
VGPHVSIFAFRGTNVVLGFWHFWVSGISPQRRGTEAARADRLVWCSVKARKIREKTNALIDTEAGITSWPDLQDVAPPIQPIFLTAIEMYTISGAGITLLKRRLIGIITTRRSFPEKFPVIEYPGADSSGKQTTKGKGKPTAIR